MFRQALSEVRHHPGRFVSTLLAIAISVAFLAGSAVLVATESQAQGKSMNVPLASADIVVSVPETINPDGVGEAISKVGGIEAQAPVIRATEAVTAGAVSEMLDLVNLPPEPLRWAQLTAGRWPSSSTEVVLSAGAAKALGAQLNGQLRLAASQQTVTVVGLTNEPSALFLKTGYVADSYFTGAGQQILNANVWSVKATPGTDLPQLVSALNTALHKINPAITAALGQSYRDTQVASMAQNFDIFANVLWGFAAISLIVGMITIANTFSITLAQRRRQIGLLRAVGASGAQVRRRFLAEAMILGLLGSLLGLGLGIALAVGVTAWTQSLFWGLALPLNQLLISIGLGVLATVVAAFVPIVKGTRVRPLEALAPSLATSGRRRISVVRAIICGLLLVVGIGLAAVATTRAHPDAFAYAVGAGMFISAGVLFGAPIFVPGLLWLSGKLLRPFGPVPRLAANNAERNPRRAATTATALMLAIGLMVTLQVATASLRATLLNQLEQHYPVDLQVSWGGYEDDPVAIPDDASARLSKVSGVDASVLLTAGKATADRGVSVKVLAYQPGVAAVTGSTTVPGNDEILVNPYYAQDLGKTVTVKGSVGKLELKVVSSELMNYDQTMVTAANLSKISTPVAHAVMWLSVPDRTRATEVWVNATEIAGLQERVSGSVATAATYEQVLNVLLAITTGLLAVAVLIALIGVSNTLGLSVLERTRESALLRALGLQASSLRWMLTIEAVQVTAVGVGVGLAFGAFFGWLAVSATGKAAGFDSVTFAVDVPQTLGMIAIAVVAAALASVLPGRRAAKAAPTEALADI
jgi:putative ABC transport system permease protein